MCVDLSLGFLFWELLCFIWALNLGNTENTRIKVTGDPNTEKMRNESQGESFCSFKPCPALQSESLSALHLKVILQTMAWTHNVKPLSH